MLPERIRPSGLGRDATGRLDGGLAPTVGGGEPFTGCDCRLSDPTSPVDRARRLVPDHAGSDRA